MSDLPPLAYKPLQALKITLAGLPEDIVKEAAQEAWVAHLEGDAWPHHHVSAFIERECRARGIRPLSRVPLAEKAKLTDRNKFKSTPRDRMTKIAATSTNAA